MKRLLFIITLCMLAVTARADDVVQVADTAQADDIEQASTVDYSYVRLGYTYETLPNELLDSDTVFSGMVLDLSWSYNAHWALIGSHYSAEQEDPFYRFNSQSGIFLPLRKIPQEYTGIGGLYHMTLGADTDLQLGLEAGELNFWHTEGIFAPGTRSGSGTRISAALSSRLLERLEGRVLLRQFRYKDSGRSVLNELDETVVEANYFFTEKYSAGLSFISNDFTDRFVVNAGYSF